MKQEHQSKKKKPMARSTKRVKPVVNMVPVKTIEEADDSLKEIALRKIELKRIDADAQEAIDKIKEEAAGRAEKFKKEIKEYEEGIVAYAQTNQDELFQKKKTVSLTFGEFGFRKSTSIYVKSHEVTVNMLEKLGKKDAVILQKKANKDVLGTFSDKELEEVHCKRKVKETFWYEIDEEEITNKPN